MVASGDPVIRPIPTVLVGALGGLLVGITSVGLRLGDHDRAADALPDAVGA